MKRRRVSETHKASILAVFSSVFLLFPALSFASVDRFDTVGGASHPYESYAPRPGWGSGQQGSYYHYHVPLVSGGGGGGWGGGWGTEGHKGGGHDILLWALIGLLLLGLLGGLLLPLLLLPIGLSLLALLMGGMMMMAGGGMMMMMMMMMMPQPQAARSELVGRAVDTVGKLVQGDAQGALLNVLGSLDIEQYCPEVAVCNVGLTMAQGKDALVDLDVKSGLPESLLPSWLSSVTQTFGKFGKDGNKNKGSSFLAGFFPQKGVQRTVKRMEKAFWVGFNKKSCLRMEQRCKSTIKSSQNWNNFSQNGNTNGTEPVGVAEPPQPHVEIQAEPEYNLRDEARDSVYHFQSEREGEREPTLSRPTWSTPTVHM